jgi:hypothetical protein
MSRFTVLCLVPAAIALFACDRLVDSDFQGDSLLRIEGSVVTPQRLGEADLVPALAFEAVLPEHDSYTHQRIMDVGFQGEFPSNFTLDVFDLPPADATEAVIPGEPAFAVGYITVAHAEHPDAITTRALEPETLEAWVEMETAICGERRGRCQVRHTCTLDGQTCLHQTLECPTDRDAFTDYDCDVTATEGEESLALAGYSVNYWILYFSAPIAADTFLAVEWADGEPISAGYHLYHRVQLRPTMGWPELQPCREEAEAIALDRYNMERGTNLIRDDFNNTQTEAYYDLQRTVFRVMRELDCPLKGDNPYFRIDEVQDEPIAIELGAAGTQYLW